MKSIAALLLTIALALFPLSETRVMAAVQSHAHEVVQDHAKGGATASHYHSSSQQLAGTAVHSHGGIDHHAGNGGSGDPCAGDHDSSSCCSVSCHVMAPHIGISVSARSHVGRPVGPVALPLPPGVGFDGPLRPPRPA